MQTLETCTIHMRFKVSTMRSNFPDCQTGPIPPARWTLSSTDKRRNSSMPRSRNSTIAMKNKKGTESETFQKWSIWAVVLKRLITTKVRRLLPVSLTRSTTKIKSLLTWAGTLADKILIKHMHLLSSNTTPFNLQPQKRFQTGTTKPKECTSNSSRAVRSPKSSTCARWHLTNWQPRQNLCKLERKTCPETVLWTSKFKAKLAIRCKTLKTWPT